jgi:hypothetical protein
MRRVSIALLMLAVMSCGGDSATAVLSEFSGTYSLTTVNGVPLPFQVQASPKVEITGDRFLFDPSGGMTQTTSVRLEDGPATATQNISDTGKFEFDGTTVTMHFSSNGSTYSGTVSGSSFLIVDGGYRFLYVKQ